MKIDLHMHSRFSDGMLSPTELINMAKERELVAISLTDHDTLDGVPEAIAAGKENGVEVLAGVELSCEYNGRDLHILGYGVDTENEEFQAMLKHFRDTRYKRGIKIIEKLNALGVDIEPAEVLAKAGDGALGRPHVAAVLVEKGVVSRIGEAFDKYIGEDGPAYVAKFKMTPREAIDHIHASGGLAFMAHPGYFLEMEEDLAGMIAQGFDGIECHHPSHSPDKAVRLKAIAERNNLLVSGGSDFHGFNGKHLPMGTLDIPYELCEDIKSALADKRS